MDYIRHDKLTSTILTSTYIYIFIRTRSTVEFSHLIYVVYTPWTHHIPSFSS